MMRRQPPPLKKQICPECKGQGKVFKTEVFSFGWKPCTACNGTGYIEYRKFWRD